jgi:hypothetical protein
MLKSYCAVILNRNLGKECDLLRIQLLNIGFNHVVIVDSSTETKLASKFTNVEAADIETINKGFRICRGFNKGITFALDNYNPDWIACFPVDSKIQKLDLELFEANTIRYDKIVAYGFISSDSPYYSLIPNQIGLVWNIEEGPIIIEGNFLNEFWINNEVQIFDGSNFRGYLAFKELALRVYGKNKAMGISTHLLSEEREEFLLNFAELMKTEDFSRNKELLVSEGTNWLKQKYGLNNRWELENIVRLLHDEFLLRNPKYREICL